MNHVPRQASRREFFSGLLGNDAVQSLLAIGPVATHPEAETLFAGYANTRKSGYIEQLIFGSTLSPEDISAAARWKTLSHSRDFAQMRAAIGAHHLLKRLGKSGERELCAVLRHMTAQEMTTNYLHEWVPEKEARRAMRSASVLMGIEWNS